MTTTALTGLQGTLLEVQREEELTLRVPEFNPKPPSGVWAFNWAYQILGEIRTKGVLRTMSSQAAGWTMVALAYTWKARLVLHWRLSPIVPPAKYATREAVCNACDDLEIVDDGRFPDRPSRYCGACACGHWRWAEVGIKNDREGHNCPQGKHEGSRKRTGCSTCGGANEQGAGDGAAPHYDIGL